MPDIDRVLTGLPRACLFILLALAAVATQAADLGAPDSTEILYLEPLSPVITSAAGAVQKSSSTHIDRQLAFDAFNKRFSVRLTANTVLTSKASSSSMQLYRGDLADVGGSWVRLAAQGSTLRGMIWDGNELYVVDSVQRLQTFLKGAANVPADGNVIFRLSDTKMDLGPDFCGSESQPAADSGLALYKSIARELKAQQKSGADVRLEVSVIGDSGYLARYSGVSEAEDEALVRMNNVDGIFSAQVGVGIHVSSLTMDDATHDPFSSTTDSKALLAELSRVRESSVQLRTAGLTHLFTGRNFSGQTVGIAYVDALCSSKFGVGLSEIHGRGDWTESLIAAHEIGHNFGAVHDGEGECSATPATFLMAPNLNGSSTFSQCSLDSMLPKAHSAACVVPVPHTDLSLAADLGTKSATVGDSISWDISVVNASAVPASQPQFTLTLTGNASLDTASGEGVACTTTAATAACTLSDMAASTVRVVHVSISTTAVGSAQLSAEISSDDDVTPANNTGTATLSIRAVAAAPANGNPAAGTSDNGGPAASGSSASHSGGGGSSDVLWLAALGLLSFCRRRSPTSR